MAMAPSSGAANKKGGFRSEVAFFFWPMSL
jgi:hypothetical protein